MRSILFIALAGLAACHSQKPDWAQQDRKAAVPGAACKEVEKGVAQLRASSAMEVTDKGEATLPPAAWDAMPAAQHDSFLRTLAFHAACISGVQSDAQTVVVHGDDGTELARRSISTRVDTSEILGE